MNGAGRAGVRQLLPRPRPDAGGRPAALARRTIRRSANRRSSCSATPTGRRRFDRNPGVLGDTLIVNGQHLTIVGVAPEGFDGTTLGAKPQVFVPITLRGLMNPGFNQFHNRRSYWAYLFARLRPGVTHRAGAHAAERAVSRHHQRRRSAAAARHERSDDGAVQGAGSCVLEPGARGQSSVDREARTPLLLLLGGHRPGAAHRLREHRQPAAGARGGAVERDGDPPVDRRQPAAADRPAADRVAWCWR